MVELDHRRPTTNDGAPTIEPDEDVIFPPNDVKGTDTDNKNYDAQPPRRKGKQK